MKTAEDPNVPPSARELSERFLGMIPENEDHETKIQYLTHLVSIYAEQTAKDAWDRCYEATKENTFAIGLSGIATKPEYQPNPELLTQPKEK